MYPNSEALIHVAGNLPSWEPMLVAPRRFESIFLSNQRQSIGTVTNAADTA